VLPDAVSITRESDGRYVEVNDGYGELSGYDRAKVMGHTLLELTVWAELADRNRVVLLSVMRVASGADPKIEECV
jgi:PAS domain S-box-containing protein